MLKRICVLGGSGFVGKHIIAQLVRQGCRVKVLSRNREKHRDLLVLPTVEVVSADIHHPPVLEQHFQGQDAVVNLVGILNERRDNGSGFHFAHVELAEKVIKACQHNGVKRLLHMSALHANEQGPSYYLRSKGKAQTLVHAASDMQVTSFCPSVIFGPEDSFFNRFAALLYITPGFLPLACAQARFAPVYVGDVASAFAQSLNNPHTHGQSYNLCGPEMYTLKQLVEYTAQQLGLKRKIIGLGNASSKMMANVFQLMPLFKPLTRDNYRSMQVDSVCDAPFPTIFNIQPKSINEIVPTYLARKAYRQRYDTLRRRARRT
jgi:uncharacterized protein YbjT (DUF2867 family)